MAKLVKTPHIYQVICGRSSKHPARVLSVYRARWVQTGDAGIYSCIYRYTDNGNVGSLCYRIPHDNITMFNERVDLITDC